METIIRDNQYSFRVIADRGGFFIEATHLSSLRFSFINNLNTLLSEFAVSGEESRFSDSQWSVTRKEGETFYRTAIEFLLDNRFRDYLEMRLAENRECGEWENIKSGMNGVNV